MLTPKKELFSCVISFVKSIFAIACFSLSIFGFWFNSKWSFEIFSVPPRWSIRFCGRAFSSRIRIGGEN